ncbi:MAG: S28 family serine protease, partial [Ignavibacteria bacterium]|nr:S28 family serine protease [Ignavibacteria bacterium]
MNRKVISSLILFLFISSLFQAQSSTDLLLKLKSIKEIAEIKPTSIGSSFTEGYEIFITQPLDHKNPNAQTFTQRIFLSHVDYEKPVVLITEGYSASYNYKSELSQILGANQIIVEHRYFGKSVPAPLDWKYLDIEQAAGDHHSIVQIFKTIYPGKW